MRRRSTRCLTSDQGFTLIELLVVLVILGVLVAIAVPSYLGFRGSGQNAVAESNVRTAIPAAAGYFELSNGSYAGMDNAALKTQSPGVSGNVSVTVLNGGLGYCLDDQAEGNAPYYYVGGKPGATSLTVGRVSAGTCS
jgi:prepilin-type N-terminal cleavage/methylation domain